MAASDRPGPGEGPLAERIPGWVAAVIVLAVVLNAAGALIAQVGPWLLTGSTQRISDATRVYAGYLTSRDLAVAIALLALLTIRARRLLSAALVLAALIQVIDVVVDASTGRLSLLPGLLVLTVLCGAAAARLSPGPLWRTATWQDARTAPERPSPDR